MDTKVIEYMLKLAEENNITHAAEKLFITQSALNQQLLKLEKELGTPLFYRSRTDWRATDAGEVYLGNAREILRIKKETYQIINDLTQNKQGTLSIGLTPGRGIAMFTAVYPKFHQKYPQIVVEPRELSVKTQHAQILSGALDLGFVTLCEKQRVNNQYETLMTEEIYLAVPSIHPICKDIDRSRQPFPVLDIAQLQHEPFILMYKESTIRNLIDGIFNQAGFLPNVLFETSNTSTIISMIQSNLCCGLIPSYYLTNLPEGVTCFSLSTHPTWDVAACWRKNSYQSTASKNFIAIAKEYWNAAHT
ncbi:MAG: LysR substrate-binding domain-containing protein [Lachnospiraceae bacterium]